MTIGGFKSNRAIHEELDWISTKMQFEDCLSTASQVMEIYEMFDKAAAVGFCYGQGYQDGFWAGRKLDAKYQLARIKSISEKHNKLLDHCED